MLYLYNMNIATCMVIQTKTGNISFFTAAAQYVAICTELQLSEDMNALRRRTLSTTRWSSLSLVATFVLSTSVLRVELRPTSYNMSSIGWSGSPLWKQAREIIYNVAKYVKDMKKYKLKLKI